MPEEYTYCFIRTDIPLAKQVVQIGHIMDACGAKFGHYRHRNLVVLGVANEDELCYAFNTCLVNKIDFTTFYESDGQKGMFGLATEPVSKADREPFREFKLWGR